VPASIAEVTAAIRRALVLLDRGRQRLQRGYDLVGEALDIVLAVLAGSVQSEVAMLVAYLVELRSTIEAALAGVDSARRDAHALLDRLGTTNLLPGPAEPSAAVLPPRSPRNAPVTSAEPADPPKIPRERIEALRRELPPPVQQGKGQKTHGRWIGPDGQARPIVSGRDEVAALVERDLQARGMPGKSVRASDVEMKLAAHMVRYGIKHATVVINHVPCRGKLGCDQLVPILLPEGSTLTVHGETVRGQRFYKKYTGGAQPWWR